MVTLGFLVLFLILIKGSFVFTQRFLEFKASSKHPLAKQGRPGPGPHRSQMPTDKSVFIFISILLERFFSLVTFSVHGNYKRESW